MTIFTVWFQDFPNNLFILLAASAMAGLFVYTFARSAMVAEGGRQGWASKVTSPNTKLLFTVLFVAWAIVAWLLASRERPSIPSTADAVSPRQKGS